MPVNGESQKWHKRPPIVKSDLKLILVFVKHSPAELTKKYVKESNSSKKQSKLGIQKQRFELKN